MATTLELQLSKDVEKIGIEVSPGKIEQKQSKNISYPCLPAFMQKPTSSIV